jgi:F-type H+-transporting ATPase subunit delta
MAKISQNELAQYIVGQLEAGKNATTLARRVAEFLVSQRRSRELGAVMRKVVKLREQKGMLEATITSATPLSVSTKSHIKTLLGKPGKVVINDNIDPSVVGGVRIETAERGIDLTVENQLKQLKRLVGVTR